MALAKTKITELTVQERACQALVVEHTEAQLEEMAQRNADVKEITDGATHELVKQAQRDLRVVRMSIEIAGKVAREDARAFSSAVIEEENRLIHIIKPEEDRLKDLSQAETARKKAVAEEKRTREVRRIQAITERIDRIKGIPMIPAGSSVEVVKTALAAAQGIHIDDSYEEYAEPAQMALTATISALSKALEQQEAFEAQKVAMEAQQAQMAEQQRQMDEQAAAQKVEADRIQAEKQAAEDERLELIRKENARLEKAQEERLAKEKAETDAAAAQAAAEEAARKEEEQRPAKDKLIGWAKMIETMLPPQTGDSDLTDMGIKAGQSIRLICAELVKAVEDMGTAPSEGAF